MCSIMNTAQILQTLFEIYPSSTCPRNFNDLSFEEYVKKAIQIGKKHSSHPLTNRTDPIHCYFAIFQTRKRVYIMVKR